MNNSIFDNMSVFEQSRWFALVEAINIIAEECDNKGKNFNKIKISPLDLEKYIENTCDMFARKIEEDRENILNKNITLNLNNIIPLLQEVNI